MVSRRRRTGSEPRESASFARRVATRRWLMPENRVHSREFRADVVRRILGGEKVPVLSGELGIHRKLLYEWKRRVEEGGEANLRERGRPRKVDAMRDSVDNAPKRIAELERLVGRQQLTIDFFKQALQQIEELRQKRNGIGVTASLKPSRQ